MKIFAFVGILAFAGYASAQCGCLKAPEYTVSEYTSCRQEPVCSKQVTVVGKSAPPATVIRESVNTYVGQSLPIRVQAPAAVATTVVAPEELRYRVVETVPSQTVRLVQSPSARYNTKVEVPVQPASVTSTTINLKPYVDRIVVPSSQRVLERRRETVYVNPIRETPVYVNPIREAPVYINPIRETPVYVNPIRETTLYSAPVAKCTETVNVIKPLEETVYVNRSPQVYVNTIRSNPSVVLNAPRQTVSPCGPILGNPILKKLVPRYGILNNPFLKSVTQVGNDGLTEIGNSKKRSKREVPFLRHGYKFMINMLPEFIKEPITNTVNTLALTHPDKRLQRMYNRPPKLTLIEKLQLQKKKNMVLLKNKLRNRLAKNNLIKKPYAYDKAETFQPIKNQESFFPRSKLVDRNTRFDQLDDEYVQTDGSSTNFVSTRNVKKETSGLLENTDAIKKKQKITQLKKALLIRKLEKLNEDQSRTKRSTIFEKHWSQKYKKSSKKHPNLFDTSDIVLPFYQVKEESLYDDPWEKYSSKVSDKHRYSKEEDSCNFPQPYSFRDVVNDKDKTKERFLRNVIRQELGKYKIQKEEEQQTYVGSPLLENKIPHSPILHVITFPLRLISTFNDFSKQAFPMLGSLPQMVTGTKKYFKDFGKKFKKNMLHLTSDLIGDFENLNIADNVFGPVRQRRSPQQNAEENIGEILENQYKPNYFLVFDGPNPGPFESKIRQKRYILKKVDDDEIEEYLLDKLSVIFDDLDGPIATETSTNAKYPYYHAKLDLDEDEESEKKLVLQHLKPKIILDNNGKPFLEINGYKRPLFRTKTLRRKTPIPKKTNKSWARKLKNKNPFGHSRYYDFSEEADSEKIDSLIHHAKNHMENNLGSKFSEMPIKTIKEKISQLLFETDILVHMDFEKYDDIYDDLLAVQHMKNSIVQDWKRLIMSKDIDDIGAKTLLLERFKELQYYKDVTLSNVVASLYEDNDNVFIAKKLIKILVRLQKLQCLINQVVSNFQGHLHISNKSDIEKEIKYADFLNTLNFANEKSRNDMISNLMKDRDAALQRNILLLNKLKKLLKYEMTGSKVEKEAKLLWEMRNIEKMQKTNIEEMKHRLDVGYKIKNELKILFDLLKRYEACEEDQKELLSKHHQESKEEEDESVEQVRSKRKKPVEKKIDLEELRAKWQERLRKRNLLLKKQLKKSMRKFEKKSKKSDDD